MTMRLRTFGTVYIERNGTPLFGPHAQRRRLALLAYLAAAEGAPVTRDKLLGLLWPESSEPDGRHSLSQLLYSLRHDLGPDVLAVDHETVALDSSLLGSDVNAFDVALHEGRLEDAVAEYRGAFLDGFHIDDAPEMGRWIDSERVRRESLCARALEHLAGAAEATGDLHRAREWWARRSALDPMDGRVTLSLMRTLVALGDRRAALHAASVYTTLVREDLDTEPDRAVSELAHEIRRAKGQPPPASATIASGASEAANVPEPIPEPSHSPAPAIEPLLARVAASAAPQLVTDKPRPWRLIGALAFAAVLVAMASQRIQGRGASGASGASAPLGAVVVIDALTGADTVLALAVREALRAELSNTGGIVVTSDLGIRDLRALARLPQDSALPVDRLLGIATRAGAHALITGSVTPVGDGAQIVVDVIDPGSGKINRTLSERPLDARSILTSVERMGRQAGAIISRAPRDQRLSALPAVTTPSLTALKSYAIARQMSARGRRKEALEYGERAVIHDTAFVSAHYLLGDLLWFLDEQTHSDAHLTRAYELRATVPRREQLMISARYEQLVRDRPDSALGHWDLLRDASPGDALSYEGRAWALRALGRHEEAAAAADTAMMLDPGAVAPNTNNAMYSWLAVGDTASALALAARVGSRNVEAAPEARFYSALSRGDLAAALLLADSSAFAAPRAWRRQLVLLERGEFERARANLDSLRAADQGQFTPRGLLNQGWVMLRRNGDSVAAQRYAREALAWLGARDLSPPAVARLAERIGDLSARAGDEATVRKTIALVRARDNGRSLRSYVLAQRTLDASLAFAGGDYRRAALRAMSARHGVYFWRSLITIVQLESDSRRAFGDIRAADSLDQLVRTHQIVDGDFETWAMIRAATEPRRSPR